MYLAKLGKENSSSYSIRIEFYEDRVVLIFFLNLTTNLLNKLDNFNLSPERYENSDLAVIIPRFSQRNDLIQLTQ